MSCKSVSRRALIQGLSAAPLALAGSGISYGATFPTRSIRLVVAYAVGGWTDQSARLFAGPFGEALGRTVIVENRPGAGGITGTASVANMRDDGYTLLWAPTTFSLLPALYKDLPFDPLKSFAPIGRVVKGFFALAVNSKLPVKSTSELIAYAKQRGATKLNYASPGIGTIVHLAIEMFASMAGIQVNHIPYNGNGPAQQALVNGEIDFTLASLSYVFSSGLDPNVRPIGITSLERDPLHPTFPTVAESGLPGYEVTEWDGLVAPANVSAETMAILRSAYETAAASPALRQAVEKFGYEPTQESASDFRQAIETEMKKWTDVVKTTGIVSR
jgi:tripartite-type tricarboxylate transporter receptor subunit TctC